MQDEQSELAKSLARMNRQFEEEGIDPESELAKRKAKKEYFEKLAKEKSAESEQATQNQAGNQNTAQAKAQSILKSQYIDRIRRETAYPRLRGMINVLTFILILIGVLDVIGSIGGSIAAGNLGIMAFAFVGVIIIIISLAAKEASIVLIDIADSITDLNYRYDHQ